MSRRRALIWCGAITGAAALCYFAPLFRIRVIDDARNTRQGTTPSAAIASDPDALTDFVDELWRVRLRDAASDADDIETLCEAIDRSPVDARAEFGRQVGLGGASFFFVRGAGQIEAIAADQCVLRIGQRSRRVCIRTGVIVGNAVRDATGLIDVNQFANSQDFNRLSAELNQRVEMDVIAPSVERLRVGAQVSFVGCAEVNDDRDLDPFCIVPVELEVEDPEARP